MSKAQLDTRNLNQKIYSYLRDKIVHNDLKPGTRIDYNDIANELGVSKTPLRDALQLLQQDGLIEVKSRSGTFVSTPNQKDIEEIFEVRKALERQAIKLAMPNISHQYLETIYATALDVDKEIIKGDYQSFFQFDRHFHKSLVLHSKNGRLIKMMESLEAQITWIGVMVAKTPERPRRANEKHKDILNALIKMNISIAQDLMDEHIEEVKQMTLKDFI
ncbi:GntR family transcriptional regulator [Bacillus sp. V5-8f]|uniref:GntR family transcriptional regulator n=1 Tax=Bacillus sp. V5-8f TaxID=2053044 RepID=UPI002155F601|nr:GntR family transcriptional regulator [Bacillus sp. V5-8f]